MSEHGKALANAGEGFNGANRDRVKFEGARALPCDVEMRAGRKFA
jgi:hypothetical protein